MFIGATNLEEGLMLWDGLCWVYDPPICLYGELSIFWIAPTLRSLYLPLIISYTRTLLTHVSSPLFVVVVASRLSRTYYLKSSRIF